MTVDDVGEDLAYRVFFAAYRRRVRLLVVAGLIAVTVCSGVAVALTHRSGAHSTSSQPVVAGPRHASSPAAARREIYAIARAQYRVASASPGEKRSVTFGPLVLRGDKARLPVSVMSGPLGGIGQEVLFARDGTGHWRLTEVRQTWIS
jgi:hypothetical protein